MPALVRCGRGSGSVVISERFGHSLPIDTVEAADVLDDASDALAVGGAQVVVVVAVDHRGYPFGELVAGVVGVGEWWAFDVVFGVELDGVGVGALHEVACHAVQVVVIGEVERCGPCLVVGPAVVLVGVGGGCVVGHVSILNERAEPVQQQIQIPAISHSDTSYDIGATVGSWQDLGTLST